MDYDKLINDLRWWAAYCGQPNHGCLTTRCILDDAATSIETLRADLARVTAELNGLRAQWDMYGGDVGITETYKELERVTAERDAAVSDIETALAYGVENCELCANSQCHLRGGTKPCLPKWHGIKED